MLTSQLTSQAEPLGGVLDTILGLPVHPLAVHIPVVFLPVAALGLLALILIRPLRRRFALLTLAGLAVGTGGAFLAAESGEMLAARVGEPETHAQWGGVLPFVAAGLLVLGGIWLIWARQAAGPRVPRAERRARAAEQDAYVTGDTVPMPVGDPGSSAATARRADPPLLTALGIVSALAAIAVIALTVVVGHLGSEAAWADRIAGTSTTAPGGDASPTATPSDDATASASPSPSGSAAGTPSATPSGRASGTPSASATGSAPAGETYTMADVARHDSDASCWTVIDGGVYDVTEWISRHPGGPQRIENLCGIDGSSFFDTQHGTAERPNDQLAEFRIGDVGRAG